MRNDFVNGNVHLSEKSGTACHLKFTSIKLLPLGENVLMCGLNGTWSFVKLLTLIIQNANLFETKITSKVLLYNGIKVVLIDENDNMIKYL